MALYTLLCGATLMIILSSNGCHSSTTTSPPPGTKPPSGTRPAPPTKLPPPPPPPPRPSKCGIWEEGQGHMPWQSVVVIDGKLRCLGNLISSTKIVTDGHCKFGRDHKTVVALGHMDMANPLKSSEEQRDVVEAKCDFSGPESALKKEGICVLTMSHPVNFSRSISPVCIASWDSHYLSGMGALVSTGTSPRTNVKVPIIGHNECKCTYHRLKPNMICAGYREKLFDTCGPDRCLENLGGGLYDRHGGTHTLIGVTGLDQNCPSVESLRLYSSVAASSRFIQEATKDDPVGVTVIKPKGPDPDVHFECINPFYCPEPKCPHPGDDKDASVFDSDVSVRPSSLFVLLCVLLFTYYGVN